MAGSRAHISPVQNPVTQILPFGPITRSCGSSVSWCGMGNSVITTLPTCAGSMGAGAFTLASFSAERCSASQAPYVASSKSGGITLYTSIARMAAITPVQPSASRAVPSGSMRIEVTPWHVPQLRMNSRRSWPSGMRASQADVGTSLVRSPSAPVIAMASAIVPSASVAEAVDGAMPG